MIRPSQLKAVMAGRKWRCQEREVRARCTSFGAPKWDAWRASSHRQSSIDLIDIADFVMVGFTSTSYNITQVNRTPPLYLNPAFCIFLSRICKEPLPGTLQ